MKTFFVLHDASNNTYENAILFLTMQFYLHETMVMNFREAEKEIRKFYYWL